MAILEAKNLTFSYPDGDRCALEDISFAVNPGEFVLLLGPSGSGKSTLLRLFKREIAPHGRREGEILFRGKPLERTDKMLAAKKIGFVFQDPENQIVMDHVLDELVFGLENMGMETDEMRKRVAEMAHFFGIHPLLDKEIHHLSGGQKQLINLASVLLMGPDVLLLDEPTAQLDPVATKDFLHIIKRMNEEFGLTVLLAEHRLDEVFPLADRVLFLERGKLLLDEPPKRALCRMEKREEKAVRAFLPAVPRLFLEFFPDPDPEDLPLSVKEGKRRLGQYTVGAADPEKEDSGKKDKEKPLLEVKAAEFRYGKDERKVLDRLSLTVFEGELLAIVGANGTGKSTLLKAMAGLLPVQRGRIFYRGKKLARPQPEEIAYLPQNPKLLFIRDTIGGELAAVAGRFRIEAGKERAEELAEFFRIRHVMDRHPYDVSGGELQKAALAALLLPSPRLLLLDEPTKGMDPEMKREFADLLKALRKEGTTVVLVTHDIEFAAGCATRCAMMFAGRIAAASPTEQFFKGNSFYTTAISRLTRNSHVPEVISIGEARKKWTIP